MDPDKSLPFRLHHIHIKTKNVDEVLDFYVNAFDFRIFGDEVRPLGDRFVRCGPENGEVVFVVSSQRDGEILGEGSAEPRFGLDHFGIESTDLSFDVARLEQLGAKLVEGPIELEGGIRVAFMTFPGPVRAELVQSPLVSPT